MDGVFEEVTFISSVTTFLLQGTERMVALLQEKTALGSRPWAEKNDGWSAIDNNKKNSSDGGDKSSYSLNCGLCDISFGLLIGQMS